MPGLDAGSGSEPRAREGRLRRHLRMAGEIRREPKRIVPIAREVFIDVWRSRGGGFYGLGYVFAFVYLQIAMFAGDLADSESFSSFAVGQVVEYLIRFGFLSFVNVFLALLWPFYVLEHLGGVGIIVLVAGYALFEHGLRPLVEKYFPELRKPASQNPDQ